MKYHFVGGIIIPVIGNNSVLLFQIIVGFGMGERSQHGELGNIQLNFKQKVDELLDTVFGVMIQAQQNSALNTDAIIVVSFNPVTNIIRRVKNRLINIPGPSPGRQLQYLRIILDWVTAPFFLQGNHLPEQIHLPPGILRQ